MKPFIPSSHIVSVETLAMLSQAYAKVFRRSRQIFRNELNLIRDDALYEDTRQYVLSENVF